MALKGKAKVDYQRAYMRDRRGRGPDAEYLRSLGFTVLEEHRQRKSWTDLDKDVLRLAQAGYPDIEICELLDLGEEALREHLERVAEYLAPTAASQSVETVPFDESINPDPDAQRGRRDMTRSGGSSGISRVRP